jgi:hypothetical protein
MRRRPAAPGQNLSVKSSWGQLYLSFSVVRLPVPNHQEKPGLSRPRRDDSPQLARTMHGDAKRVSFAGECRAGEHSTPLCPLTDTIEFQG